MNNNEYVFYYNLQEAIEYSGEDPTKYFADDSKLKEDVWSMIERIWENLYVCYAVDTEDGGTASLDACELAVQHIENWIAENDAYYNQEYAIRQEQSLGTATSVSRYNDTPQGQGDWSDDKHTTNVTSATSTGTMSSAGKLDLLKNLKEEYFRKFLKQFAIIL